MHRSGQRLFRVYSLDTTTQPTKEVGPQGDVKTAAPHCTTLKSHAHRAGTLLPGDKAVKTENQPASAPVLPTIPITIYLTPRQLAMVQEMAENDGRACVEDAIVHDLRAQVVEFVSFYDGSKEATVLQDWNCQGEPTQLATVTLDARATAEARRCLEGNPYAPVDHLGDLVNAAVEFFADDTDQCKSTLDFVEEAKARRLAREEAE